MMSEVSQCGSQKMMLPERELVNGNTHWACTVEANTIG